jgi:hypothetical protein
MSGEDATQFPDVSHYQQSLSLAGAAAVLIKATQGVHYVDPAYHGFVAQARQLGIPYAAYHWLDTTDAAAQAAHAYAVVGPGVVLMIDDEQNVINVAHTLAFVAEYRRLGGCVRMEYAPRWTWVNSGRPSLTSLAAVGLTLVSSSYPDSGYSDNGIGWLPYGGVTPGIWQWTDAHPFNGQLVDFNATHLDVTALFDPTSGGTDMTPEEHQWLEETHQWVRDIRYALFTTDPGTPTRPASSLAGRIDDTQTAIATLTPAGGLTEDQVHAIVREELDATHLAGGTGG